MITSKKDIVPDVQKLQELESERKRLINERQEISKKIERTSQQIIELQNRIISDVRGIEVDMIPEIERKIAQRPWKRKRVPKEEVVIAFNKGFPRDLFLGATNMKSVDRWMEKLKNGERP